MLTPLPAPICYHMCKYEFSGWDTLIASSSFWLKTPIVSLRPFLVNKYHDVCSSLKPKEHRAVLRTVLRAVSCVHVLQPPTQSQEPHIQSDCTEWQRCHLRKWLCTAVSTLYSSVPCRSCFSLASSCVKRRVILSIRACKSLYSLYSALKSFL